jgi:hypothetical protein
MKCKTVTFVLGLSTMLALPALAANTKICFEAEKPATIEKPLLKVAKGASSVYSGAGYLEIPWDGNKTKGEGQAVYKFRAAKAGLYTLWARTLWAQGCGNSILGSVNGDTPAVIGEDGTYGDWHWLRGQRVALKAGVNTLVLKNRETGIKVDQFFLCSDTGYEPTKIRKTTQ